MFKQKISTLRKLIKRKCPSLSVRGGRGTAYGCVNISGSMKHGYFTEMEKKYLKEIELDFGMNFATIPSESIDYWITKIQTFNKLPEQIKCQR